VTRGETDRTRILAEVGQAQRLAAVNQDAEDAAAAREIADRSLRLLVDADGDELLQRRR
jgi:hypothetical protein